MNKLFSLNGCQRGYAQSSLDMPVETGLRGSAVNDTVCIRASSSACHSL